MFTITITEDEFRGLSSELQLEVIHVMHKIQAVSLLRHIREAGDKIMLWRVKKLLKNML